LKVLNLENTRSESKNENGRLKFVQLERAALLFPFNFSFGSSSNESFFRSVTGVLVGRRDGVGFCADGSVGTSGSGR
jgi:hypothetical protein